MSERISEPSQAGDSTPPADMEARLTELVKKAYLDGCMEACGEPHRHNWNGWWEMFGKSLVEGFIAALAPSSPSEGEAAREAEPCTICGHRRAEHKNSWGHAFLVSQAPAQEKRGD